MPLRLTIELPAVLAEALRRDADDPARTVIEALAIALYREGKITHRQLGEALGLDRHETSTLLHRYRVFEGSMTLADVEADRRTLEEVLGPVYPARSDVNAPCPQR